jgi:lysophospholipase
MVYGNGGNLTGWLLDLPLATPDGDDLFNDKNQAWFGSLLWSVEAKANKSMLVWKIFLYDIGTEF